VIVALLMLDVQNVTKYISPEFQLSPISFQQPEGENLALMGVSGSGKTTLLQLIAGWQQPDSGSIWLQNQKVKGPHEQLVPGHPGLAILQQTSHLPHYYYIRDLFQYANVWESEKTKALLELCRIHHLLNRKHFEISGGEKQRIALALLLVASPSWLLLDEPFSHLDLPNKRILQQILREVSKQLHITTLLCTHNPDEIFGWADRVLVLENGKLIQSGTPQELYESPNNSYVAGLLGDFITIPTTIYTHFAAQSSRINHCASWIIRPENVIFHPVPTENAVPCVIQNVIFAGRSYKVEVEVMDTTLFFYTDMPKWTIGAQGFVSIRKGYCLSESD